jgi:hypothetical protein
MIPALVLAELEQGEGLGGMDDAIDMSGGGDDGTEEASDMASRGGEDQVEDRNGDCTSDWRGDVGGIDIARHVPSPEI